MASTRRSALLLLSCFILLVSTVPLRSAENDLAGKVTRLAQSAVAMQDAVPRVLKQGSEIRVGDVISTGPGTRLEFELLDGSTISLGERTIFVVSEYVDRPDEENIALRLLEGSFKAATGALAKDKPEAVTVETELGSIGIRGTTFWGGKLDGVLEVAMLEGKGIFVETRGGRVELTEAGQGTRLTAADTAPSPVTDWPAEKVARALATVNFDTP